MGLIILLVSRMTPHADERRIKVTKNGPYLVLGGVPLASVRIEFDEEGTAMRYRVLKEYPISDPYYLCRCGRSGHKPFCDGTHAKTGFDGTETGPFEGYEAGAERIEGPGVTLLDNRDYCVGARFCHRAGGIWELTERSDDERARETAEEIAAACPSGRLVVCDRHGRPIEPETEESIHLIQDRDRKDRGPIWARGGILIESADDRRYEARKRVTLCRCGRSGCKPFCDGSHLQ